MTLAIRSSLPSPRSAGQEPSVVVGLQSDYSASFNLNVGTWTISVDVDDDATCPRLRDRGQERDGPQRTGEIGVALGSIERLFP